MKWHLTCLKKELTHFWALEVINNACQIRKGKLGTLGVYDVRGCDFPEDCINLAQQLVNEKKEQGYVEGYANTPFKMPNLPADVIAALAQPITVNTVKGIFRLSSYPETKVTSVVVTDDSPNSNSPRGYYFTCACVLGESNPHGGNYGSLVWLPAINSFGSWQAESFQLYIFENVSWRDITDNYSEYLICDETRHDLKLLQDVMPLESALDFIPTELPDKMSSLLNTKDYDQRIEQAASFLVMYEDRLLRNPFTIYLESCYAGLIKIYHSMAKMHEGKKEYVKAVQWLQKSLPIAIQSPRLRTEMLADIFLQLSYCYMEKAKFDLSLKNLERYQLFDSSTGGSCEQIRNSIMRVQQLYSSADENYRQEVSTHSEKEYSNAISILQHKLTQLPNDPDTHYRLARFYAATEQPENAIQHLREAFINGFSNQVKLSLDSHFKKIRHTRQFKALVAHHFGNIN